MMSPEETIQATRGEETIQAIRTGDIVIVDLHQNDSGQCCFMFGQLKTLFQKLVMKSKEFLEILHIHCYS